MASFSHPISIFTTNSIPITTSLPISGPCLRFCRRNLSVQNHQNSGSSSSSSNSNPDSNHNNKLDRRNILIGGLAGVYGGAATTLISGNAAASPAVPDVGKCSLTSSDTRDPEGLECCPQLPFQNIVDFDIRKYKSPDLRVRRPAHLVADDPEYMAKFKEAIRRMKALHRKDPRNFFQQANVHCAYCDGAYKQVGSNYEFLVHSSWLFFPFHRAYLFFFERILGDLIEDPNFAIPYWNWDHPDGMRLPEIYADVDSPLFDELRDAKHQPPRLIDLNYNNKDLDVNEELQIKYNLRVMKFQMTRYNKAELFMGGKFVADTSPQNSSAGPIENVPHNAVHSWVGSRDDYPYHRNMGSFFSAARDPIFYAHHANIDRMWHLWNTELHNKNLTTPDWLDTYFIFYDENKQGVKIRTRDMLDIEKQLGYIYEYQDLPWKNITTKDITEPKPITQSPVSLTFPRVLDSVIRTRVARPKAPGSEVIDIYIRVNKDDEYIKFDVYVNDGQEFEKDTNNQTEVGRSYAGSFVSLPHKPMKGANKMDMNRRVRLPLTDILEDLGDNNDSYVDVAIVPRAGKGYVEIIKDVEIGYVI